jgi:hypothetical protein
VDRKIAVLTLSVYPCVERLCGLVVRVPGYSPRGHGFDSRHQTFRELVGRKLEPLSIVTITEERIQFNWCGNPLN